MTLRLVPRGSTYMRPCADYGVRPAVATEDMVEFRAGENAVVIPRSRLDEARKMIGGGR